MLCVALPSRQERRRNVERPTRAWGGPLRCRSIARKAPNVDAPAVTSRAAADYGAIPLLTFEKTLTMLEPSVLRMVMQTSEMRTMMSAYSTRP